MQLKKGCIFNHVLYVIHSSSGLKNRGDICTIWARYEPSSDLELDHQILYVLTTASILQLKHKCLKKCNLIVNKSLMYKLWWDRFSFMSSFGYIYIPSLVLYIYPYSNYADVLDITLSDQFWSYKLSKFMSLS